MRAAGANGFSVLLALFNFVPQLFNRFFTQRGHALQVRKDEKRADWYVESGAIGRKRSLKMALKSSLAPEARVRPDFGSVLAHANQGKKRGLKNGLKIKPRSGSTSEAWFREHFGPCQSTRRADRNANYYAPYLIVSGPCSLSINKIIASKLLGSVR